MDHKAPATRFSVAPMMDWTDRHCRVFHRQFTRHALLYTEMVTAPALIHGDRDRLLAGDPVEASCALQLGGSVPAELAEAVKIAAPRGYDEINLNVGCPSDRVQSGCFGAVLMKSPALVADCVKAMQDAAPGGPEITVKCRIGVDEQDPEEALPTFLDAMQNAGVRRVTVHARKAWLEGLSPKDNRTIPPLDYPLVHAMKRRFDLQIFLNGGLTSPEHGLEEMGDLDGVMLGRAAYHEPAGLGRVDRLYFGAARDVTGEEAVRAMLPYIEAELTKGERLNRITRHMLGAFQGRPGARGWRRMLSEGAHQDGAGPDLVEAALARVTDLAA
ncbi:tRNA dihydrouridine(20/20a) synthase DusA [Paracoccaceae bacterium GXU_MW_L88]